MKILVEIVYTRRPKPLLENYNLKPYYVQLNKEKPKIYWFRFSRVALMNK